MSGLSHEDHIRSTITAGSVYYYHESSIGSPLWHNFVVINIDPYNESTIFLVCCSSKIDNRKKLRATCPPETLVVISPYQYSVLTSQTVIDCNRVFEYSISEIAHMFLKKKLQERPVMDLRLVKKLREGVMLSPMVEKRIQKLLQVA